MFPSDNMQGSLPTPDGAQQGPGVGGGYPAAPEPQADPKEARTAMLVAGIIQNARLLANMYPAASEEMRTIANAMSRAQQKIVASRPAPETAAPPV